MKMIKKKIIVDILLFLFMLLEFSRGYMEPIFHEIFGVILIILVIIHLILNRHYIKSIDKGKYNATRMITLVINIIFFMTFVLSLICGILSSQDLFSILNVQSLTLVELHKIFAYISLIFMGLHLGVNFNAMFGTIKKKIKHNFLIYLIEIVIVIYGIYSFMKLNILEHVTGVYGFSMIEGNIYLNITRYFMIVMMIAIIMHHIQSFKEK